MISPESPSITTPPCWPCWSYWVAPAIRMDYRFRSRKSIAFVIGLRFRDLTQITAGALIGAWRPPRNRICLPSKRRLPPQKRPLSALFVRQRQIKDRLKSPARAAQIDKTKKAREDNLKALKLAATGASIPQIAAQLNTSPKGLYIRIWKAWYRGYPEHYNASRERISSMGRLAALRHSPPLF